MKARLPKGMGGGPQNMNQIIKQAQKMQDDMKALQEELDATEYVGESGSGVVKATVNGKEVPVIKSNVGFMAVECESGHNDIRFTYTTPGLLEGLGLSLVFVAIFLMYIYIPRFLKKYKI